MQFATAHSSLFACLFENCIILLLKMKLYSRKSRCILKTHLHIFLTLKLLQNHINCPYDTQTSNSSLQQRRPNQGIVVAVH
jgi:hypothetical protein